MDWVTAFNAAVLLATASVAWFTIRATRKKLVAEATLQDMRAAEGVTDAALKLIEPLTTRIEALEAEIKRLTEKIEKMSDFEEYLQGEIHARDKEIKRLTDQRAKLVARVTHLEMVCKRAGINGDD